MEFSQFLVYLFASGGNVAIASWILERSNWFQGLESSVRQYSFYAISSIIGIAAWLVATFVPSDTISMIAPVFAILYLTFGSIFLGGAFHIYDKKQLREKEEEEQIAG